MAKTPEQIAEDKIESELEEQGWEQIDSDSNQTGYDDHVTLPDGREADYVLYLGGRPVAIIEAKKKSKKPKNHLQQARNYAKVVAGQKKYKNTYVVPFVFASNGEDIVIDDLREGTPDARSVQSFYSPDDISRRLSLNIESGLEWLSSHSYEETDKKLWDNQIEALANIKEAIQNRQRRILVSMATGSGKTRLAMALTYQLLESGYASQVLFVPDTSQLARDALRAFRTYDPLGSPRFSDQYIARDFTEYRETGNADVVVSTIQKAYTDLKDNPEEFSVGEFDVVIADECHRGIYNSEEGYGRVLDYYDSVEIGLTATPHQKTIQRYNNNHVYSYDYHEALEGDKVVPFRPYVVQTEATMEGIVYDGTHYPPSDFGTNVLIHDTHRKVAEEIADIADIENELTLVFAQNVDHANVIAEDFRQVFSDKLDIDAPEEFVKTITNEDRHRERTLDNFDDKRRNPRVAVTVDMVSTGVDVRPLKNLVFLRAVKSSILYNQMVGRGTRNIPEKEFFRIFDCIGVLDYHDDKMFSTENLEIQYTDTDTDGEYGPSEDPKEIEDKDIDRVVKRHQAYPLNQGFVEAAEFITEASKSIENNRKDIRKAVADSKSIEEADKNIEKTLVDGWQYFTRDYILDAAPEHIDSLFELASEVIVGYNIIKENAQQAKKAVEQKYDLTDEQSKWIQMFIERCVIEKETISKRQLLEKPFSDHGGYDRADELFTDPDINTVIEEFNRHLLALPIVDEDEKDKSDVLISIGENIEKSKIGNDGEIGPGELKSELRQELKYSVIEEELLANTNLTEEELDTVLDAIFANTTISQETHAEKFSAFDFVAGGNIHSTKHRKSPQVTINLEGVVATIVSSMSSMEIGGICLALSIIAATLSQTNSLVSTEASLTCAVLWELSDGEIAVPLDYKNVVDTTVEASKKTPDEFLVDCSKESIQNALDELATEGIIDKLETDDGVIVLLNEKFNADWNLYDYVEEDIENIT